MPSVISGGDEFTDLPEAPTAIEDEGTQAPYGISKHRTIVEERGEGWGCGGLPPEKLFIATLFTTSETLFWNMV